MKHATLTKPTTIPLWKQAASEESVDHEAVTKMFMDQAYSFVANKAKALFKDPYRLGFEVVHRNDKATQMFGIFAFRCNGALIYIPVFFVHGEIKPADLIWRTDVKRMCGLTEEVVEFLVGGGNESAGELVTRNNQKQTDHNMRRLSQPLRTKYASVEEEVEALTAQFKKEAADGTIYRQFCSHCAEDPEVKLLLPQMIKDDVQTLEKIATIIEQNGDATARFFAENYDTDDFKPGPQTLVKQASEQVVPIGTIKLVRGIVKDAAVMGKVAMDGYALIDDRPDQAKSVVETILPTTLEQIQKCGVVDVLDSEGEYRRCVTLPGYWPTSISGMCRETGDPFSLTAREPRRFWNDGLMGSCEDQLFGRQVDDAPDLTTKLSDLKVGECYIFLRGHHHTDPYKLEGQKKEGRSTRLTLKSRHGDETVINYLDEDVETSADVMTNKVKALKVKVESKDLSYPPGSKGFEPIQPTWTPMTSKQVDKWIRTAGNTGTSTDVTVRHGHGMFDLFTTSPKMQKSARTSLSRYDAHLAIASLGVDCDEADALLDKVANIKTDRLASLKFRVYHLEKNAYMTYLTDKEDWQEDYDPVMGTRLDSPQEQTLNTSTPDRPVQQSNRGEGIKISIRNTKENTGMPQEMLMNMSPEELAHKSKEMGMPHVLDHSILDRMAGGNTMMTEQIRKYIPDIESGLDKVCRVLFLLRYRPDDFIEDYGKEVVTEMEEELAQLVKVMTENWMSLVRRFDIEKFTTQSNMS